MSLLIFGGRSPLIVDYEETAARAGIAPVWIAHMGNGSPRALDRKSVVLVAELTAQMRAAGFVACAFSPTRRAALISVAETEGLSAAAPLIDPMAVIAKSARIGAGVFVNAGVIVAGACRIGAHALVNRASSIGHHSVIGRGASIGPAVHLASNVTIGDGVIIGAGSIILPDVKIGARAIVAAGSVVRKNVEEEAFVVGSPARPQRYNRAAGIFGDTDAE